jgi:ABC-type transport system involved in multi-copper enzyme maturation permease subunit
MTVTPAIDRMTIRQVLALARQEFSSAIFSKRAFPIYVLVVLPIMVALLRALFLPDSLRENPSFSIQDLAQTFHLFILRFILFFSAAALFINLIRGEILDRSLHYRLLVPMRREAVIVGKYIGGVCAAIAIFVPTVVITAVLFFLPHGSNAVWSHLASGSGLANLLSYLLAITLACFGYGSLFLLAGLLFRNPMIPVAILLGWEGLVPLLPPALKMLSVAHHLISFSPVPLELGTFALLADPAPRWVSTLAVLGVSAVALAFAAYRSRSLEIMYSAD